MKKKPVKQETLEQKQAWLRSFGDGYEAGRRAGLVEASNVLMEYRDKETGVKPVGTHAPR